MKKVTVCEEYVRMCSNDELAAELLHAIVATRGRIALVIDRKQVAARRYMSVLAGAGRAGRTVKELLLTMYRSGAYTPCEAAAASSEDKSLFANTALQTRRRQVACESKITVLNNGLEKELSLYERLAVRGVA